MSRNCPCEGFHLKGIKNSKSETDEWKEEIKAWKRGSSRGYLKRLSATREFHWIWFLRCTSKRVSSFGSLQFRRCLWFNSSVIISHADILVDQVNALVNKRRYRSLEVQCRPSVACPVYLFSKGNIWHLTPDNILFPRKISVQLRCSVPACKGTFLCSCIQSFWPWVWIPS